MSQRRGASKNARRSKNFVCCLVGFCVLLIVVCACLITALVFVGKHILYNAANATRRPSSYEYYPLETRRSYSRLSNDTEPIVYEVTLLPDLRSGLYKGSINITLNILNPRKDLVIHSKNLTINEVVLQTYNKRIRILGVKEIPENEVLVITSNKKLLPATYFLYIKFEGVLFGKLTGFYRSQYRTSNGDVRQIATSKFEPTYARQAFPCFDEPNFKAKYKVHLLKPKDESYIALSNYPVQKTEDYDDSHKLVSFEETVSMSTYLSCFIVSDFTHTETSFDNKGKEIPLKVYASPENLNKTIYAGEVGKKVIEYYVKYFGIPYPLPKLDMVAIPDFVSGAMEHWGLVTYRETALLYTSETHSTANKQRVATVVAHELAHSWFGNLVTMDWWDDLWLNEGFASYIEYKGTQAAEPTWGMLDQFPVSTLHSVLSLDATLSSHPIVQTVQTPDQITEIFDTISYNKGSSVLRMLESVAGNDNFQKGVTNYLNKYAYSNAVTKDFLTEIQKVVGEGIDVIKFMDTFTIQMGYPILNVNVSGDSYVFTQKRFLKDPEASFDANESIYKYKWTVPITYVTDKNSSSELFLFKYNEEQLVIKKPEGISWIKFNKDQIGYYRVNYPLDLWKNLIDNYVKLTTSDRTHLLEESFSIAEAGQLSYAVPLDLTNKLVDERDYTPWKVASTELEIVLNYLTGYESKQEENFKKHIIKIVKPAYEDLGWLERSDDGHLIKLARVEILNLACLAGYDKCLDEAKNKFSNWINTTEQLSQDLRDLIYKYGMKHGNEEAWERLLEIYKSESDASEKLKLMNGLANVQNTTLLERLIELSKDESIVRGQDFFTVLQYIAANPTGTELVWNWVRDNWPYLVNRFTLNDRYLGSLIPAITKRFATEAKLEELKSFFEQYPEGGAGTSNRKKALETVQNNIRWLSDYSEVVENWTTDNNS